MCIFAVTPLAGVWIEITTLDVYTHKKPVTPLAGVWIEIESHRQELNEKIVTPLAGVWIEIKYCIVVAQSIPSLPLRECGLKSKCNIDKIRLD